MAAGSDFAICQRLMELASDPDNQAFILKEQGVSRPSLSCVCGRPPPLLTVAVAVCLCVCCCIVCVCVCCCVC